MTDIDIERRLFVLRLMGRLDVPVVDREDVCQDALLRFYAKGYDDRKLDPGPERALLARVAYTTWLDRVRRRRGRIVDVDPVFLAAPGPDPAVSRVKDLVGRARLAPDDIEMLEARFGTGRTAVEIATARGQHPNTVRRRLGAILARLRRIALHSDTPAESGRARA